MLEHTASEDRSSDHPSTLTPATECRVLWIETDDTLRNHAAALLGELGYRVTVAADAFTAMDLVAHDVRAFDVVVVDLALADLEGMELAHYLRSTRADWPLILCGGAEDCEWLRTWASDGCLPADFILEKPIQSRDLEHALRHARRAHRTS